MQVAAAASNALGECVEIAGRLGLELGLNQFLVNAGAVQRLGGFSCGGQRVHQGEREARGVRVRGHQPSPPVHGVSSPALRFGVLRELFQCPSVLPGQVDPLLIHPALELWRVAQVETVQEGSAVELDGAEPIAPAQGVSEQVDVAADDRGIETDGVGAAEHRFAELGADGVDQLLEIVSRLALAGLGPEKSQHLVAAYSALARGGHQREKRQPTAVRHDAGTPAVGQRQSAEGFKLVHSRPLRRA